MQEFSKKSEAETLTQRLRQALTSASVPDLALLQQLIEAGADPNLTDEKGRSVFSGSFFYNALVYDAQGNSADPTVEAANAKALRALVQSLVAHGWDTRCYGLGVMHGLVLSTYDAHSFDLMKLFCAFDLGDDRKVYEDLLESIGTEESYQRCCEEDHACENLFYTMYEVVQAKMEGKDPAGIGLYREAVGLTVDAVLSFHGDNPPERTDRGTVFHEDIGFLCGERLLVLRHSINILFMDGREDMATAHSCPNLFRVPVVGAKITDVSFSHKNVVRGTTHYGQPTIILSFDNGTRLRFTHNFGEQPDAPTVHRFYAE